MENFIFCEVSPYMGKCASEKNPYSGIFYPVLTLSKSKSKKIKCSIQYFLMKFENLTC